MEDLVQPFPSLLELLRPDGRSEIFLSAAGPAERLFYRADLSPVTDRRNRPIGRILVLSDTTQQELLMEKLREMATTDELTGAFNRHHFMEVGRREISRAKRYGRPLSLLVLDLDFFKGINDTLGHEAGDRVLKATCDALKKVFRSEDVLGRHGGDEFVVLLPETSPDHAFGVAERLRATIARNAVKIAGDVSVTTTASFGVAGLANVGNESVEDVIRAADRAMYKAKEEGRNCVCRANV